MTASTSASPSVAPSALTTFINSTTPAPIALTHPPHYHHLAAQVLHNLRHQHDWTRLLIHTHSPLPSSSSSSSDTSDQARRKLLPRPLISGLPPHRIYVHPDEQVEMLKAGVKEGDVPLEREWVLPTHLREKWSLRRFAEVFDMVGEVPSEHDGNGHDESGKCDEESIQDTQDDGQELAGIDLEGSNEKRRGGKRVLLATVSDDSAVVYYIVHDGIVKPRQN